MRVAVIGGGWAGLAAAVELTAGGIPVTLFEAGRIPGGRARSAELDGRRLDNGQHILLGAYRETLALMRRVGADPDALLERHPLQVLDSAGFRLALPDLPPPFNLAWGLLAARGPRFTEKLAAARWMRRLQSDGFRLGTDTTVAAWLDACGQRGTLRRHLWEPLCLAALNTQPEIASAQVFANVLRDSLGSPERGATDLLLPQVPLGEVFPGPAASWLAGQGAELRFGQRVAQLAGDDSGVSVDGERFAAAIVTTAPQHLPALLPDVATATAFEPIATIWLQYPETTRLPYPLHNLGGKYGQWVVDRGNGLLACVQSGSGAWEALADDDLVAALAAELGLGHAGWHKVVREKRATFSCRPGTPRPGAATTHPRIALAGDHTWSDYPATLEGAVRSGLHAAQVLSGTG
jgi:squalene-associated FAD-dependent desaturase